MNATAGMARGGRQTSLRRTFAILNLALAAAILAAAPALAAPAPAPSWTPCLECHDDATLTADATGGETVSLTVSAGELAGSAHRSLDCRGCHPSIQLDDHPTGDAVASPAEYRLGVSKNCLTCHSPGQLREKSHHAAVALGDQQISCVECHGSHGVRRVAAWKSATPEPAYCLGCHSRAITRTLPGGGTLALDIDAAALKASVHPDHECSDCHADFSRDLHPAGVPEAGHRGAGVARACGRCHADKLRQTEGGIHFSLLRSGAAGAPGCADCHSAHAVAPKERFATLTGMPCRRCHEEIFAAYTGSMHGKAAAAGGHLEAPLCSDCHRAHQTQGSARPELVRAACIGCHPTSAAVHAAWLPNASLHLDAVSCAACHAPAARRVVTLRLVEDGTERVLAERDLVELLGGSAATALDPTGNGIDGLELWSVLRRLEARRGVSAAKLKVVGRLEVARGTDAHRLADKSGAVRSCESCHESGSPAFGRVAVSLAGDDGRPQRYEAAPEMLTDAASVLSVRGFYALGSTRHGALDWLLVLAVAGGLSVVAAHLSMRLWSARSSKKG